MNEIFLLGQPNRAGSTESSGEASMNVKMKLCEIGKHIHSKWKDLPEKEKQNFTEEYLTEKASSVLKTVY